MLTGVCRIAPRLRCPSAVLRSTALRTRRHNTQFALGPGGVHRVLLASIGSSKHVNVTSADDALKIMMEVHKRRGVDGTVDEGKLRPVNYDFKPEEEPPLISNAYVVNPPNHKYTVIWFHGIGETLDQIQRKFELSPLKNARLIAPAASKLPLTVLDDYEEVAWFDVMERDLTAFPEHVEDKNGVDEIYKRVEALLDEETQKIDSRKIVLAGFAQGGALALHAGLRYKKPLGAVALINGFVALPHEYPKLMSESNQRLPIAAAHGTRNTIIPFDYATNRYKALEKATGVKIDVRPLHGLQHDVGSEFLMQMSRWWQQVLGV